MTDYPVKLRLLDGSERVVMAVNIHHVGDEGARSAIAIVDGREVPIYNRVEWGFLWEEQANEEDVAKLLEERRRTVRLDAYHVGESEEG